MDEEIWKPIPNHPGYDVSNLGRVRSYWDNASNIHKEPTRILWERLSDNGYVSHRIKDKDRKIKYIGAHRLVALAFIGPPPYGSKSYVCHNDGIKSNNRLENLRYDTPKANSADAIVHGVQVCGQNVNTAKLMPELVVAIRYLYGKGKVTQRQLADLFEMSRSQIGYIVRGESWSHLFDSSIESLK